MRAFVLAVATLLVALSVPSLQAQIPQGTLPIGFGIGDADKDVDDLLKEVWESVNPGLQYEDFAVHDIDYYDLAGRISEGVDVSSQSAFDASFSTYKTATGLYAFMRHIGIDPHSPNAYLNLDIWVTCTKSPIFCDAPSCPDLDGDGYVGFSDFNKLVVFWGQTIVCGDRGEITFDFDFFLDIAAQYGNYCPDGIE